MNSPSWFKEVHDQVLPKIESTKRIKHQETQNELWKEWIRPQLDMAENQLLDCAIVSKDSQIF